MCATKPKRNKVDLTLDQNCNQFSLLNTKSEEYLQQQNVKILVYYIQNEVLIFKYNSFRKVALKKKSPDYKHCKLEYRNVTCISSALTG